MSAPSIEIRFALPSDADAIVALVNGAYRGEGAMKGWTTEAGLIGGQRIDSAGARELIRPPESQILLAFRGGLVGCVNVAAHASGDGYFGMLAVAPESQTGGVGARLIEAAERWARNELGARGMRMTVLSVRSELIAYYERRGYRATGDVDAFPYDDLRFGEPFGPGLTLAWFRKALG